MRHSIYRKLGVFAIAVSLLTGLFQKAEAQQANTGNYDLSLSVKSATVKTFTEAFTQKTGVLFSYEAGLAQKPMGDINIDVKVLRSPPSWMTCSGSRLPASSTNL